MNIIFNILTNIINQLQLDGEKPVAMSWFTAWIHKLKFILLVKDSLRTSLEYFPNIAKTLEKHSRIKSKYMPRISMK